MKRLGSTVLFAAFASLGFLAVAAEASHQAYTNVQINGVPLDSLVAPDPTTGGGGTSPTISVANSGVGFTITWDNVATSGGTENPTTVVTFVGSGLPDPAQIVDSLTVTPPATPTSSYTFFFPSAGTWLGTITFNNSSSTPEYIRPNGQFTNDNAVFVNVQLVVNPEPGTVALFGLGALGLAGVALRRKRRNVAKS